VDAAGRTATLTLLVREDAVRIISKFVDVNCYAINDVADGFAGDDTVAPSRVRAALAA
jgi:hypothetical protein